MMARKQIRGITFNDDGSVVFEYAGEDDARANGMLRAHFLMVPPVSEIVEDRMQDAYEACQRALAFALGEFESSSAPEGADEDLPGYDNPVEREAIRG